ncbi:hypothetical protein BY996DRAFT_1257771 [Phakopsora pachyrhizi]|nr:hypothetical protein BY996DRAFT_1257771 [Phakopsora pachyrhizi]
MTDESENGIMSTSSAPDWQKALQNLRNYSTNINSGPEARTDSRSRWQRAGFFATKLVERPSPSFLSSSVLLRESTSIDSTNPALDFSLKPKTMDYRYWLEIVDPNHRNSDNLRPYHSTWKKKYIGNQDFFYVSIFLGGFKVLIRDSFLGFELIYSNFLFLKNSSGLIMEKDAI